MNPRKRKMSLRVWTGAALIMAVLTAGLLLWRPPRPASSADAPTADMDRYFKKAGVIQIPRIPPPVDAVLTDLNGGQRLLSEFKGKVVVLNFWTTWCSDCRVEMPAMEKLYQHFEGRGFAMLAVDLRESPKTVQHFFDTHKLSFTALIDNDGQVGRSFGIRSIPTTFIIDQSGGIVGKVLGSLKWDDSAAVALFERLISNPPDDQPVIGNQIKEQ